MDDIYGMPPVMSQPQQPRSSLPSVGRTATLLPPLPLTPSTTTNLQTNTRDTADTFYKQIQRLDDFDWYAPPANRTNFTTYLPIQMWQNGAFLIRSSKNTKYALTVIYDHNKQPSDRNNHAKHISIFEVQEPRAPEGRLYHINDRGDEDYKFSCERIEK